jgi:hypothetical protein
MIEKSATHRDRHKQIHTETDTHTPVHTHEETACYTSRCEARYHECTQISVCLCLSLSLCASVFPCPCVYRCLCVFLSRCFLSLSLTHTLSRALFQTVCIGRVHKNRRIRSFEPVEVRLSDFYNQAQCSLADFLIKHSAH